MWKSQRRLKKTILKRIYSERPMLEGLIAQRSIAELEIRFVSVQEIVVNSRTGKLRRVVDQRKIL